METFFSNHHSLVVSLSASVTSSIDLGELNLLFSRYCDLHKAVTEERPGVNGVASETTSCNGQNQEPECARIRYSVLVSRSA